MRRSPLRKQSKSKIPTLKRKLWRLFSDFVKKRDKNICFTCGLKVEGANCQAGHFIPKSVGGLALYFHPDNVHVQCGKCNLFLQGNQYVYGEKLGSIVVENLRSLQNIITKWTEQDFLDKIEYYERRLK